MRGVSAAFATCDPATSAAAPHAGRARLGAMAQGGGYAVEQCEPGASFRDVGFGDERCLAGLRGCDGRQCVDGRGSQGGALGDAV